MREYRSPRLEKEAKSYGSGIGRGCSILVIHNCTQYLSGNLGQNCSKAEGLNAAPFNSSRMSRPACSLSVFWHRVGFMGQIKLRIRMGIATAVKTSTRPRKKGKLPSRRWRLSPFRPDGRKPLPAHRRLDALKVDAPYFSR